MTQHDRDRQDQSRYDRDRNRQYDRQQRDRQQNNRQQQDDDWARQVPWTQSRNPYGDYGWERHESALPEFRDPDVHVAPYEREQEGRVYDIDWNKEYNYGQVRGPYTGMGPKGYQRSDDRIFEDVCDRLTQHGRIDARNIEVKVNNGEVFLTGSVDNRQTKRMAEDLVERVRGVKDVRNELHVMQQGQRQGGMQSQGNRGMQGNQSGMPGGGRGRIDEVGGSGVFPASGPWPEQNAPVQGEASWGQGDRGAAGYQDSGRSEINNPPQQGQQDQQDQQRQGKQQGQKKS